MWLGDERCFHDFDLWPHPPLGPNGGGSGQIFIYVDISNSGNVGNASGSSRNPLLPTMGGTPLPQPFPHREVFFLKCKWCDRGGPDVWPLRWTGPPSKQAPSLTAMPRPGASPHPRRPTGSPGRTERSGTSSSGGPRQRRRRTIWCRLGLRLDPIQLLRVARAKAGNSIGPMASTPFPQCQSAVPVSVFSWRD